VQAAFNAVGIDDWKKYVEIDPIYYRPTEVESLIADASKAKEKLGWQSKVGFDALVKKMMRHDLKQHGLHEYAKKIEIEG